ncbi:hypothetical protein J3U37_07175 [Gilliamella sp. B3172]|uniref:hypothetical protein n=1 Tax=Gilliamella sp. B3172 TaxID=2818006 RepID=UPI00226ADFED|nr:hypothetical protein [Gilliamella sp. B3172]MCX8639882.1 hypothetical protein [Gilliamella sp. B3172]
MKRIALISLVSLALFGCGEKKINEEMLVGDWECNITQQLAKWKNGAFQEYGEVKSEKTLVTYKIYDGVIIRTLPIELFKNDWESYSVYQSIYNIKGINITDKNVSIIERKIDFISENEYRITGVLSVINGNDTESVQEKDNFKNKLEEHCIKIKH